MKHTKLLFGSLSAGIITSIVPVISLASCSCHPSAPIEDFDIDDSLVFYQTSGVIIQSEDTSGGCHFSGFSLAGASISDLTVTVSNLTGLEEGTNVYATVEPLFHQNKLFTVNVYFETTTPIASKYVTFDITISNKAGESRTFKNFEVYGFTNTVRLESNGFKQNQTLGTVSEQQEYTFNSRGYFTIVGSGQYSADDLKKLQIAITDSEGKAVSDITPKIVVDEHTDTFSIQLLIKNFATQPANLNLIFTISSTDPLLTGWSQSRPLNITITKDINKIFKCTIVNNTGLLEECNCCDDIVTIPETTTVDGKTYPIKAVRGGCCTWLPCSKINFGDNIEIINANAINECINLRTIKFGKNYYPTSAQIFSSCYWIENFEVSPENPYCYVKNNALISKEGVLFFASNNTTAIPDEVIVIANHAFSFTAITNITIPNNVTELGKEAFAGCYLLESVTFANDSKITLIPFGTFTDCISLTNINLPNSITTIYNRAFSDCASLTSINLPTSLTTIGQYAFAGCLLLENVTLPEGLTTIDENAFVMCLSITNINIPSTTKTINGSPFVYCANLEKITVSQNNPIFGTDANNTYLFENKDGNKTLVVATNKFQAIPEDITHIGNSACHSLELTTVDLKNVTSIGEDAFAECEQLTSVTFSSKPTAILQHAFYHCTLLNNLDLSNVIEIGENCFCGCESLDNVTFGNNSVIKEIPFGAFQNCRSLTTISIPDSVTKICQAAFYSCTNLSNVTFGENSKLESISSMAFELDKSLKSITIPASVNRIFSGAFTLSGLTSAIFKNPNNWYEGSTKIDPTILSDPVQAAKLLLQNKEINRRD